MLPVSQNKINLEEIFPFPLDEFQKQAVDCLDQNKSILVCAPTGAGKTAIAEYAIHAAIAENKRIFYTSPLKALSNQKFYNLSERFGQDKVGLLTGDIQSNRDAEILVLTTEIFRNMLYKADQEKGLFDRIGYVVLDECHYMKDANRGTVWEESIIYCPRQAQIIGLSATVGNPEQLCDWMNAIHGETVLIKSEVRPVPLRFFFYGSGGMKPLMNSEGKINLALFKGVNESKKKAQKNKSTPKSGGDGLLPSISRVISELKQKQMLPVIYFLFSRRGCETALQRASAQGLMLLSDLERIQVDKELAQACRDLPWLADHSHFKALKQGIASHHAGLLPALKSLVEKLFQKNLIKVVFATETLAAGINMPARSVVISQISKRADEGHRLLSGSEFLQMAGRAGRRGMDEIGYVMVLETPYEGIVEVSRLALSDAEALHSSFNPNYIMILNLTARYPWDKCRELVLQSFAHFEKYQEIKSLTNTVSQLSTSVEKRQGNKDAKKDSPKPGQWKYEQKSHKRLINLNEKLKELEEIPWPDFEKAARVLRDFDYLDENYRPIEKGLWAGDLRGDNILLLAEIITNKVLNNLGSLELCGLACALSSYEIRWKDQQYTQNWAITDKVEGCVRQIYELVKQISKVQEEHEINQNIPFSPSLIQLGFDWASSYNWKDLVDKYQADEGDLVKALKQGADLLKQITVCDGSSTELAARASQAYDLIYRSPIKDELEWD
jgi:superfamily II RNA helicase